LWSGADRSIDLSDTSIAELGRAPFDLNEAESEIVAGFHIEYTGMKFGLFYAGELLHAITVSALLPLFSWAAGSFAEQVPILGVFYLLAKAFVMYYIMWVKYSFSTAYRPDAGLLQFDPAGTGAVVTTSHRLLSSPPSRLSVLRLGERSLPVTCSCAHLRLAATGAPETAQLRSFDGLKRTGWTGVSLCRRCKFSF
jgi:hypothetical protein